MPQIYKAKWILPANGKIIENSAILVKNGKIIDIISDNYINNSNNLVNYGNAVITPGFINLHTHLQFTDLVPAKNNKEFIRWIINLLSEYAKLDKSQKISSLKNGIKEALLSGTTCIAQLSAEEEFLEIFNSLNIRIYVFLETFSNTEESSIAAFLNLKKKIEKIQENKSNLIRLGISPHSVYNVHTVLWKKISEYSFENNILVHTHLAETEAEINWLKTGSSEIDLLHKYVGWNKTVPFKTGLDPAEYLEKIGILNLIGKNLILAHLCQLQEKSFEKLFKYDVSIVHCPRSNILLAGKTLDPDNILKSGFSSGRMGIGTDSKFSNYDLNIINEAKFIKNNTSLGLLKLLDMLTIDAAKILRLDNIIGSLEKGKEADFLVFRLNNNESYSDFIEKNGPDDIYIQGKPIVTDKKLI